MKTLSKQDFYKLAIVIGIFAIILLIFFVTIYKREQSGDNPVLEENKFSEVTNYNIFFFVNDNINTFISYTANRNLEGMLAFLDENYKREKNINITNIENTLHFYSEGDYYSANLTKSYQINEEVTVYYTEGQILNEGFEETTLVENNVKYLLYVDFENMAASMEILQNKVSEEEITRITKEKRINTNVYNKIKQVELIDTKRICNIYLNDFITKVYNDQGFSYTTNFESRESFDAFIKNNALISDIKSCNTNLNSENKRVYTIIDTNNNRYIFTEENILNYKVSISK